MLGLFFFYYAPRGGQEQWVAGKPARDLDRATKNLAPRVELPELKTHLNNLSSTGWKEDFERSDSLAIEGVSRIKAMKGLIYICSGMVLRMII